MYPLYSQLLCDLHLKWWRWQLHFHFPFCFLSPFSSTSSLLSLEIGLSDVPFAWLVWQILAWTLLMCSVVVPRGCVGEVMHQVTDGRCRNWSNNLKREKFQDSNAIAFLKIKQHLFCSFMSAWSVTASPPLKNCWFWSFSCSFKQKELKQSDKATLQVQLNSEGALLLQSVATYWLWSAQSPMHGKWLLFFFFSLATHVIRLLLVCLDSDATLFVHSCVQLASELCLSTDRYSFLCTVLSLGWCNEFKKKIKDLKWSLLPCVLFSSIYFMLMD